MDLGLESRVAIVTGGGTGIGRGIAKALSEEGAVVVVADIDRSRALDVAREIQQRLSKGKALAVRTDVTDVRSVNLMIGQTVETFGDVHILVNNAGITIPNCIGDVTENEVDKTVDVNLKGAINCIKEAVPYMKKQRWGRIINMSSTSGVKGSAGLSIYSMSKFGLRGLTQALGLELGRFGITVNAIAPSDIYETGSWSENPRLYEISMKKEKVSSPEELRRKRIEENPLKRACTVVDVTNIVLFLASEKAGYINAQTIHVNGGVLPS